MRGGEWNCRRWDKGKIGDCRAGLGGRRGGLQRRRVAAGGGQREWRISSPIRDLVGPT